ncbi:MAG: hydroxyacid dehydrogenase [Clostridiales bacterium]|nr:hydroxyacid dehydrogenase [Clostridiales bacterium]
MKILIVGSKARYEKNKPEAGFPDFAEMTFFERGTPDEVILEKADPETEVALVDAIAKVSRKVIEAFPKLKLIHSEGVGYEGVDIKAATERGIYVCNNKGINAGAVAEQAILLMLGILRRVVKGDAQVRSGLQMKAKEQAMIEGITELGDCSVGLLGFGDIGQATASRLRAFGSKVYYYDVFRLSEEKEAALGATYLTVDELAAKCDFISIHAAVTAETENLVNADFLSKMKPTAYLINTARGEIVDNLALREAIITGSIAGAGLDTIAPEPTTADNPVVDLPEAVRGRVIYSPHFGGITLGAIRRGHINMWKNIILLHEGKRPANVVNEV